MAFSDSSGNKFTNHSSMKSSEAKLKAKGPSATPKANPADEEMDPTAGGESDGAAMAQQHGPAVQIDIQHDHEGGQHNVHAMHADGHEHETQHGSAAEAHKYAADCAGGGMQ